MKTTDDGLTALTRRAQIGPAISGPTLEIDGQAVAFVPGDSILRAARRAGITIPTLCDDPRLDAAGSCRLCSVKVAGMRRPVAACTEPATEGAQVVTVDPELTAWREVILELLLSEHPDDDCPRCDTLEPCELHTLARELGVSGTRFAGRTRAPDAAALRDDNPFIARDYSRCISCYRCTRMCSEVEQAHAVGPAGRGFDTRIATGFDRPLLDASCSFCGQCVQTCPTGALTDRKRAAASTAAPSDQAPQKVRTICPYCGTGCGIELNVVDDRVVGVTPDRGSPVNEGALCVKGQFGLDFVHHRERLRQPLVRRDGRLVPTSWDEALDLVATRFSAIRAESGPDAFALWSSSRAPNEANYLMQKLARAVIGTNNIDNCART